MPGEHVVDGLSATRRGILTIKACGPGSILQLRGPSSFEGMEYVELSGMRIAAGQNNVMRFVKCDTVVIRSVEAAMPASRAALFHILASSAVTIDASAITVSDGIAVVLDDGPATTGRLTNNRINGAVSFYGQPANDIELAIERLFPTLAAANELDATQTEIFLSDNSFTLLTLGRAKIEELNQFALGNGPPPRRLFASGVLTNNVIRDNRSIFLAKLLALGSTSLLVRRTSPLSTFIADTAAVAGTVSIFTGDEFPLFVVTRRTRCDEAANIPLIRRN